MQFLLKEYYTLDHIVFIISLGDKIIIMEKSHQFVIDYMERIVILKTLLDMDIKMEK
jgi:hypothetical protein